MASADSARVLIYSHDSFGLGHLRRCRTIAHALVERIKGLSVLILSGSPIIGSFDFRARVDFVRVPGVIKLRNGEYTSLNLHLDIEETLALRGSIIRHTAEMFDPDVFIVDKEPLGLRGEVHETLAMLKNRGSRLVLGLRDVMDEPALLAPEWERKKVVPALRDLYDDIWIYGVPQICEPLEGLPLPKTVRRKLHYTGYLERHLPGGPPTPLPPITRAPYLLVTTGGGGDGEALVDAVLGAYEHAGRDLLPALLVLGPFMAPDRQAEFMARVARLPQVQATTFETNLEVLMANATGVVAMGGYNTFCEVLSFNRPALIVPRTVPRLEQAIRAERAGSLGLVRMLGEDEAAIPERMAKALRALAWQDPPSARMPAGLMQGLDRVHDLILPWLGRQPARSVQTLCG
ncbi:glycosyltransferase family protein [Zavarzinia sp. CC-PAN008]|uniref:glycosyltransferase family protein n=1 Tax=Zavarzinia sp. CC-PAN008 TaxID=3243332 RepID=UPI003F749E00